MSPCPRRPPLWRPAGRRTCRWPPWSSRCSPAPWWCGGAACGRGGPRWGLPRQQLSGGSRVSWTSSSLAMVPRPLWRNLMGGYRRTSCGTMDRQFGPHLLLGLRQTADQSITWICKLFPVSKPSILSLTWPWETHHWLVDDSIYANKVAVSVPLCQKKPD